MSVGSTRMRSDVQDQKYDTAKNPDEVNASGGAAKAESSGAIQRMSSKTFDINLEYWNGGGSQKKKKDEFAQEKIDGAMIASLVMTMLNKANSANIKNVSAKLASIEVRTGNVTRERNKEIDISDKKRAEAKQKEKDQQTLEDIGLGFSVALTLLAFAALFFLTGGVALAGAAAVISGVMTAMDVANRAVKDDPKATYKDVKGNEKHIEISIAAAVDRIVDLENAMGHIAYPADCKTQEQKDKYLADLKMGISIAVSLAITITTVAFNIASVKSAVDAVKNAAGIAAKAAAAFKATATATIETIEMTGQIATGVVDGIKSGVQLSMADDVHDANVADNKANQFSFQAEMLSKEAKQARESMSQQSRSVQKQKETVKKVLDALMAMDEKTVNV